jgi:hypothetical protein
MNTMRWLGVGLDSAVAHGALVALSALALFSLELWANPIPWPMPASMPLEQMRITIGGVGTA